jgi:hypothetical protein
MLHKNAIATSDVQTPDTRTFHARPLRGACWALLAAVAAIFGCSDDPVSLGGEVAVDRSALSSYAAVWEGYVEAYTFPSGSDGVRLVLDGNGQGTLTLGEGTPRPMPTDAEDPFPDLQSVEISILLNDGTLEGFEHEIASALIEEGRLRARTQPTNVYGEAACALQTPTGPNCEDDGCSYSCIPNNAHGFAYNDDRCFDATDGTELSCKTLELCSSFCVCTSTECFAQHPGNEIILDGALDEAGTKLVGSLDTHTVRLTRQP